MEDLEGLIPPIVVDIISRASGFSEGVAQAKADMAELSAAADETAGATDGAVAGADSSIEEHAENVKSSMADMAGDVGMGLGAIPLAAEGAKAGAEDVGKAAEDMGDEVEEHAGRAGGAIEKMRSVIGDALGDIGLPIAATSSKIGGVGEAAEGAESGLGKFALGGAAALVGVAAAATDLGIKMDDADAKIATATGTSLDAAKRIGDAFLGMGGKTESSGEQLADAYASVAGQLKATEGQTLSAAQAARVMQAASNLAEATQTDLGSATSATAGIMQAFGVKAAGAAHVSDALYKASEATGTSVGSLAKSLEKARSKLGDTSGSVGDLSALLVDLAEHGVTGRAAMSTLNGAMNSLQKSGTGVQQAVMNQKAAYDQMDPTLKKLADRYRDGQISYTQFEKASEGMPAVQTSLATSFASATTAVQTAQAKYKELGVTVFNQRGRFVGLSAVIDQLHPKFEHMSQSQQLATASTIFGASAARQMVQIINAGPAAYNKASDSVNKMGSAAHAAGVEQHSLGGEFKVFLAAIKDVGTELGQVVLPILTSLAHTVLPLVIVGVKIVAGVFEDLDAAWKFLGPLHDVILGVAGAVAVWVAGQWLLDAALDANPIGLVVIAIAALIVAVVEIVKHFKDMEKIVSDVWGAIKDAVTDVWDWITGHLKIVVPIALALITGPIGLLVGVLATHWKQVEHDVATAFEDIIHFLEGLPAKVLRLAETIGTAIVKGIVSGISHLGSDLGHVVTGGLKAGLHGVEHLGGDVLHLVGLADGGIVKRPTLAVVGEAGPEAVVPLTGGFRTDRGGVSPLPAAGGTGGRAGNGSRGGGLTINGGVNVYNSSSTQQVVQELYLRLRPMLTASA